MVSVVPCKDYTTAHPNLVCALTQLLAVTVGDSPGGLYNASFVGAVYAVVLYDKI